MRDKASFFSELKRRNVVPADLTIADLKLNPPWDPLNNDPRFQKFCAALSAARRATNILPVEKDALLGPGVLTNLAEVEAHAGETEEAIKILHRLLSIPAGLQVSIARLKIDPVWDPIRNDPGFQQLLAGKELVGPNE